MEHNEILALAAQIGAAVKNSPLMAEYEAAEAAYAADSDLQNKIQEYSVQQQALAEESAKPNANAFLTESIQGRLTKLYGEITADATFTAFSTSQDKVRALLTEINDTIMREVTGQEPETGCSHNCSECGGCH